jgi:hypothetical protein
MPQEFYFAASILLFLLSSILFLFSLNVVIRQLGTMLPDETLRHETRDFTTFNRWLLVLWFVSILLSVLAVHLNLQAHFDQVRWFWIVRMAIAIMLFLGLSPLAITMALLWKTKEVIFDGIFGARH